MSQLFSQNFLEYNDHLTTGPFLEIVVKYANYFKDNEQFLITALGWFFSTQGIRNRTKEIASHAVN